MLLTEDVHQHTALPDRQTYTWDPHVHVTSRGSGNLWPRHPSLPQMQFTWMSWSQPHQHHRSRNLQTLSGWSGPLPQRKPLTQLQLRFLKCHRKRALDTAKEQDSTHQEPLGVVRCILDLVLQSLAYHNWHSQSFHRQDDPTSRQSSGLSLRKSCCGNQFCCFFFKVKYCSSNSFFFKKGHPMLSLLCCYHCPNSYLQLLLQSCCFLQVCLFSWKISNCFCILFM